MSASNEDPQDEEWVVSSYISITVLQAINTRAAAQVSDEDLQQLALTKGNTNRFKRKSLVLHRALDAAILAESDDELPKPLTRQLRNHLTQIGICAGVVPCSSRERQVFSAFIEKAASIPNRDKLLKLLKLLQETLAVVIAKYNSSPATARSQAPVNINTSPETPAKPSAAISPCAKPKAEKPKAAKAVSRSLFPAIDEATIDSIKSETGCHRAYEIFLSDPVKFIFCLIYFKNASMDLATEISRRCKCKKKVAIRKWIRDHVGPIPDSKAVRSGAGGRSSWRAFYVRELRELALVAAAITLYGEAELSRLLDSESLKTWQNIALVSDECRNNPRQLECLRLAGKSNLKGEFHAAHIVGLDLAVQVILTLLPEFRLGTDDVAWIFNLQCNLEAVPRSVNIKDHTRADKFISLFVKHGSFAQPNSVMTRSRLSAINARCVEIAKKIQSPEICEPLIEAGGEQFVVRIQQTFEQIEAYFKNRGFAFGKIWDHRPADKKTRGLLMHSQLKGVIKERHEEHTSPTPELLD